MLIINIQIFSHSKTLPTTHPQSQGTSMPRTPLSIPTTQHTSPQGTGMPRMPPSRPTTQHHHPQGTGMPRMPPSRPHTKKAQTIDKTIVCTNLLLLSVPGKGESEEEKRASQLRAPFPLALYSPINQLYISSYCLAELFHEKSAAIARSTSLFHSRFLS